LAVALWYESNESEGEKSQEKTEETADEQGAAADTVSHE
jgi:hypothetical protein